MKVGLDYQEKGVGAIGLGLKQANARIDTMAHSSIISVRSKFGVAECGSE